MPPPRKTRLPVLRGAGVPLERRGFEAMITLVRIYAKFTRALSDSMKPDGLSLPHFEVLLSLRAGEGISQQELSERLLVTKGNVCVMLQKMESADLIERREDPVDQRFHRLYLTPAGRQCLAKILPKHEAIFRRAVAPLSLPEQKLLHELLIRIETTLDDPEG